MTDVVGALFYLRMTSFKNGLRSRLVRLRQPKYLLGAVVGIAYLYFVFVSRARSRRGAAGLAQALPPELLPTVVIVGALLLTVVLLLCWLWPRDRASLTFSEAEIAFLFPAPVSRKTLIHYRLIGLTAGTFFTSLIFALISNRWSFMSGGAAIRIAGWWIVMTTFSLHVIGSSFVITRLLDSGMTSLRRQLLTLAVVAVVATGALAWVWHDIHAPRPEDLESVRAFTAYVAATFSSGPLPWLLLPAKFLVRPMLAPDWHGFLTALWPALLVYVLHYVWVLYAEVSFEEASIARAEKRAARVAALREGRATNINRTRAKARRAPFDLAAAPRPEFAFLWKNLLSSPEYLRPRTALIAAATIVAGAVWLRHHPDYGVVGYMAGMVAVIIAAYGLVLGPLLTRQDLRSDLLNADILKVYPLRGWQIVLGEMLTPAAILSAILWLALLAAALMFRPQRPVWLTPQLRTSVALGLAVIVPFLCALQLFVLNAAAVLFPAWLVSTSQRTAQGIEVMGQRILFLFGQVFVIAVALVPAAFVAAIVFAISRWLASVPVAVILAAVTVSAVLAAEVGAGVRWLGGRFDRFDLSAELRP